MKAVGKWSVEHRVTVNLVMVFLIVAGMYTAIHMKREMFPQFSLDMISIAVEYPGASPEDVEEGICIKIEEQLKSLEDVKTMYSTAVEGNAVVVLELDAGTDITEKLNEVRTEVDLIDSFPTQAEDPVVIEIKNNEPAIYVAVYGDVAERTLKQTAEKIRDDLVGFDQISLAELTGVRDYEISVEISEENLRKFNLSFDDVVRAVGTGSIELPGGLIKTAGGEFLVRAKGKRYTGAEYEQIPLVTRADGTVVRLGDVARVVDGFEDQDLQSRFNGQPAAMVVVRRTESQDTIAISNQVLDYIENAKKDLPKGIRLGHWYNMADMVQDRIDLLLKNGIQGILLVFVVLALFLDLGLAFWVASGIPLTFMGAFLFLEYIGASVNMLSLFGFIMTLGILVDDAIIVGENVYTHYSAGKTPKEAVIAAMGQVGGPVVMAVTTTIAAFAPLMFISGIMGKFIAVMPQSVICILFISLLEAFFILPAHLDGTLTKSSAGNTRPRIYRVLFFWVNWLKTDIAYIHGILRDRMDKGLSRVIYAWYLPVLRYCIKNRYFTLGLGVACLIVSIGLIAGGHVPYTFFPKSDSNWMISEIVYPLGTPFDTTQQTIKQIENGAFKLNDYFRDRVEDKKDIVVNTFSLVGVIPRRDWKEGCPAAIAVKPGSKSSRQPCARISRPAKLRQNGVNLPATFWGLNSLRSPLSEPAPGAAPLRSACTEVSFPRWKQQPRRLKRRLHLTRAPLISPMISGPERWKNRSISGRVPNP